MAIDVKFRCQECGHGWMMPAGEGKTKGMFGQKGYKFRCGSGNMGCGAEHIADKNGHFLGMAK